MEGLQSQGRALEYVLTSRSSWAWRIPLELSRAGLIEMFTGRSIAEDQKYKLQHEKTILRMKSGMSGNGNVRPP